MEIINILYEGVDNSDIDIEGVTSIGYNGANESCIEIECANENDDIKREVARRRLLHFMAILFGVLTLSALAVFLDMYLNDPKIISSLSAGHIS